MLGSSTNLHVFLSISAAAHLLASLLLQAFGVELIVANAQQSFISEIEASRLCPAFDSR